jgi:hypothetical protein
MSLIDWAAGRTEIISDRQTGNAIPVDAFGEALRHLVSYSGDPDDIAVCVPTNGAQDGQWT